MNGRMQIKKVITFLLMTALFIFQFNGFVFAKDETVIDQRLIIDTIDETIEYIYKNSGENQLTEWQIIGMVGAAKEVSDEGYRSLEKYVKEEKGDFRKVTDYAKIAIVAITLDKDPRNVAGYDIIEKIYDNENMTLQGTNGPAFALMALDAYGHSIPQDALWSKEKLIECILGRQNIDGGFPLAIGDISDIDVTAMVIQALSKYREDSRASEAIQHALEFLHEKQSADGGYCFWGDDTSESISQVIIALTGLGIDPGSDTRFIKEGNLITKLLSFKEQGGGFSHILGQGSDSMATEQALVALVAYKRFLNNETWIYNMYQSGVTVTDKVTFADMEDASQWARGYIEKAKELGLMDGKGDNQFNPKENITRAEFAVLLGRLLDFDLNGKSAQTFIDVASDSWYYDYVMSSYERGIINGKTADAFMPDDHITREEMAVMFQRALSLETSQDVLVKDGETVSQWALSAVKGVIESGIMLGDNGMFSPKEKVTREMAATVIVRVFERGEK